MIKTSVYYLLNAWNALPEKRLEYLQRIERHVTLSDNVITALTNFARMPVPNLQPIPIERCIQESLETVRQPVNVRVEIDFPVSLPRVLADNDQLRIVLSNLIRNACEAMPNGGSLRLWGRLVGDGVEVAVRDTGVGISPEDVQRIMEPLYSTKARGLGLGLAIARAIPDKNQGTLRLESEPGRASTFTVRLLAVAPQDQLGS